LQDEEVFIPIAFFALYSVTVFIEFEMELGRRTRGEKLLPLNTQKKLDDLLEPDFLKQLK
jgi:hypothetical protein